MQIHRKQEHILALLRDDRLRNLHLVPSVLLRKLLSDNLCLRISPLVGHLPACFPCLLNLFPRTRGCTQNFCMIGQIRIRLSIRSIKKNLIVKPLALTQEISRLSANFALRLTDLC